jgi:hypothetical protein
MENWYEKLSITFYINDDIYLYGIEFVSYNIIC